MGVPSNPGAHKRANQDRFEVQGPPAIQEAFEEISIIEAAVCKQP